MELMKNNTAPPVQPFPSAHTSMAGDPPRLIVALSGASGAILGIRLLQVLEQSPVETHLIISPAAAMTVASETDWSVKSVEGLARVVHPHKDIGASIAS